MKGLLAMDLILLVGGSCLLGHIYGWELGLAVGMIAQAIRPYNIC